MYGWRGTVLWVDLTHEIMEKQSLKEDTARRFLGGRGLNSKTLLETLKPGIDPLSPENVLCLAPGPLSGTPLGLTSRCEVSTLSPYSGILGDGNAGGSFAALLKRAGYDQIVITGAAGGPKYLWIDDGHVSLLEAADLWGKTTWEMTDILMKRHGKNISVAGIGPAGEHLVRFASTIIDKYCSAARGSGAVWGSKNLKAIAVRGTGRVGLAMPAEFRRLAREDRQFFMNDSLQQDIVAVYGTHIGMISWEPGYRHYEKRLRGHDVPEALSPRGWKKFEIGRARCYGCPVACKNVYRIPAGEAAGEIGAGLEFECISCLGTNCGIEDAVAIMRMANLADKYGMCQMGLGDTISLAKCLYHHGILSDRDTGGLSLSWNDAEAQIKLIHQASSRERFGNLIAEGAYGLAKIIGRGAMDYCYHVKGLSHGPYPPGLFAMAHATSTRGADHLRGRSWAYRGENPELLQNLKRSGLCPAQLPLEPVESLTLAEKATTLADSIGRCKGAVNTWVCTVPLVWKYPLWDGLAQLLRAATGEDFDADELDEAADRIHMIEMAFNVRRGIRREHDRLPQKPEIKESPRGAAERQKHAEMLDAYYKAHECDVKTGCPTPGKLKRLGLQKVSDILEQERPYPEWDGPPLWPLSRYPHKGGQP